MNAPKPFEPLRNLRVALPSLLLGGGVLTLATSICLAVCEPMERQSKKPSEQKSLSVDLHLPAIRIGADLARSSSESKYSIRLPAGLDFAAAQEMLPLGVTPGGMILYCDRKDWSEGYQEGESLDCYGSDLVTGKTVKWSVPEDRDGWAARQFVSEFSFVDLSRLEPLGLDYDRVDTRFRSFVEIWDFCAEEEQTRFLFQPASVLEYPGGGVFLHCAELYDNRYWKLGEDGSVARVAIPHAFPETNLVASIAPPADNQSAPVLWGYNRRGFWKSNGMGGKRDVEFVEQWMRAYDLRRGEQGNVYRLEYASRGPDGEGLLALYDVLKRSTDETIGMHQSIGERELAVVYFEDGSVGDKLHHLRIGAESAGGLGEFVASRASVFEAPESRVELLGDRLAIWISGRVWFLEMRSGEVNPTNLTLGDAGLTRVIGQLNTGELVCSASWGLDTVQIVDFSH